MKKALLLSLTLFLVLLVGCTNTATPPVGETASNGNPSPDAVTTDAISSAQSAEGTITDTATQAPETDPVETLMLLIDSSQYTKAANHYLDKIAGNYALEIKAANAILTLCESINDEILSGALSESNAKITLNVVDRVVTDAKIMIDGYEDAVTQTDASLASKAAYKAAAELVALGNFADAIKEYRKVVPGDVNYDAAQLGITTNSATLRDAAFTKAQGLATQKKYSEALIVLRDLLVVLPEDEETVGKISVYEQTHIRTAISDAEAAFVTADDYEAALSHINGALQFYPENTDLLAKKDYYKSFEPVHLSKLSPYKGELGDFGSTSDIFGTRYTNSLFVSLNEARSATYDLGKQYNSLSFTVFGRNESNNGKYGTIVIYGDGVLLYSNKNFLDNGRPFNVSIDVTGVTDLEITVKTGSSSYYSQCFGIADIYFQRTAK